MNRIDERVIGAVALGAVLAGCSAESNARNLHDDIERILSECRYKGSQTFEVQPGNSIAIAYKGELKQPPSEQEIEAFACVLAKLHELPGVTVGFTGNEIDAEEAK